VQHSKIHVQLLAIGAAKATVVGWLRSHIFRRRSHTCLPLTRQHHPRHIHVWHPLTTIMPSSFNLTSFKAPTHTTRDHFALFPLSAPPQPSLAHYLSTQESTTTTAFALQQLSFRFLNIYVLLYSLSFS